MRSPRVSIPNPFGAILLLVATVACAQTVKAQGDTTSGIGSVPDDDRPNWVVGFTSLDTVEVEPRNLYLSYSIPLVIRQRLLAIRDHQLSPEERDAQGNELIRKEIRDLSARLIGQRRERDVAAGQSTVSATQKLAEAGKEIQALTARIRYLESLDPAEVPVPDRKPVAFWSSETPTATGLLDSPRYSPLETARTKGLDLLVFGTIEQVQDYLFLSLKAVDYPRGLVLLDYQDAFLPSGVYGGLERLTEDLAAIALGGPWGSLHIRPEPESAEVRVDGAFAGVGALQVDFVRPGEAEVVVSAEGYAPAVRTLEVVAGETVVVDVSLEPEEVFPISIASAPLLADVYVDSTWVGRTPVSVPRPVGLGRVEIVHDGRMPRSFHLSSQTPPVVSWNLPVAVGVAADRQKQARNRFYGALGALILSLPVPIVLSALSGDQVTAYVQAEAAGDVGQELRLAVSYRRLYAGFLGGVFLSGALFGNMVISIVEYIAAADRPAG
jgi:hypothetical protein